MELIWWLETLTKGLCAIVYLQSMMLASGVVLVYINVAGVQCFDLVELFGHDICIYVHLFDQTCPFPTMRQEDSVDMKKTWGCLEFMFIGVFLFCSLKVERQRLT